jgi:hypothetical protein
MFNACKYCAISFQSSDDGEMFPIGERIFSLSCVHFSLPIHADGARQQKKGKELNQLSVHRYRGLLSIVTTLKTYPTISYL